jgi:hypothetical protein
VNNGLDGLRALFSQPGGEPAFYGMAEEAEMLAAVRKAIPSSQPVLWGTDYEVAGDRQLLQILARGPSMQKPVLHNSYSVSRATPRWFAR